MLDRESRLETGRMTYLFSMFIAPLTLFVLTLVIMHIGGGWFTVADIAFLCVLAQMILGRRLAAPHGATRANAARREVSLDFLQSPAGVAILGIAVWGIANIVGNFLLTD